MKINYVKMMLVVLVVVMISLMMCGCGGSAQFGKTQIGVCGKDESGNFHLLYIKSDGSSLQVADKQTMQLMHNDLNERIAKKDKSEVVLYAMGKNNQGERIITSAEELLQLTSSSMGW